MIHLKVCTLKKCLVPPKSNPWGYMYPQINLLVGMLCLCVCVCVCVCAFMHLCVCCQASHSRATLSCDSSYYFWGGGGGFFVTLLSRPILSSKFLDPCPQLLRTVCFQGLILTSWFYYYQAHIELISTANVSVIDCDTDRLDLSFSGSYPDKVSSLRDFEVLSRDMIRILSHAEIFSFAALKCLQNGNMDSRVFYGTLISMSMTFMDSMSMVTVQTLGLQQ